jgi:hypothetical protein
LAVNLAEGQKRMLFDFGAAIGPVGTMDDGLQWLPQVVNVCPIMLCCRN